MNSRSRGKTIRTLLLAALMVVSVAAGPAGVAAAATAPSAGGGGAAPAAIANPGDAAAIADPDPGDILYRVNAGGGTVSASDGDWTGDWEQYHSGTDNTAGTGDTITIGPSVPDGTPESLFQSEVYGDQQWAFSENIQSGQQYEVRLYFAETYQQAADNRVFDVTVEGNQVLTDFDIYDEVGHDTGLMKAYRVTPSDGEINIDLNPVQQHPKISAIEIVQTGPQSDTLDSPLGVDFGPVLTGDTETESVTVTNLGESGDPSITLSGASVSGDAAFSTNFSGDVTLAPGESTDVPVEFSPSELGETNGTLSISHSGSNAPTTVELAGEGSQPPVGFSKSTLEGFNATNPTSLEFGPDGRLYVSTQAGTVYALSVERTGENSYQVTNEVEINAIKNIPNHNDSGEYVPGETERQITGLTVGGTASQPVVYVASSDPSIGKGEDDDDTDTNSGAISRLTVTPGDDGVLEQGEVDHDVMVIGLPRSEENHATNALQLSDDGSTLYAAQGGNTNMGAPSLNFGHTSEFALSAAVLEIDLAQIENNFQAKSFQNYETVGSDQSYPDVDFYYGIPTIQNDDATDGDDLPFGGNDGINQAKIVENGPVQVYSPGYRNPYGLVLTEDGQLYTADHGENDGWGGQPADANGDITTDGSQVTNHPNEDGTYTTDDPLMKVDEGDYGGHPAPIRANPTNADIYNADGEVIFDITSSNSPVPSSEVNPEEADHIPPTQPPEGVDDPGAPPGSADAMMTDTNGDPVLFAPTGAIDEYTASNFAGSMEGDLLQVELYGDVKRVQLSSDGSTVTSVSTIFNTDGPLGVTAQDDDERFPGTIWTANHGGGTITAVEPNDYGGTDAETCAGNDNANIDEDGDGYDNADEIDAGTDPCSSASTPADFDDDGTSNLNDPDDDNDGSPDTSDPFAVDPDDGTTTSVPVTHDLSELSLFGENGQGWTGLMTNGSANYQSLYNVSQMTVGGAAEVLTVEDIPAGTAADNDQQYAFQFGVNPPDEPFVVETSVNGLPENPEPSQGIGVYVGTGDQDNYVKLTAAANGGTGGVEFAKETGGNFQTIAQPDQSNVAGNNTELYLVVDPTTDPNPNNGQNEVAVTAEYATAGVNRTTVATGAIPASWLSTADGSGLAVGIISTSDGADSTFTGTWADISVTPVEGPPTADAGSNQSADEGETVTLDASGSTDPDDETLSYTWTQTAGSPDVLETTSGEQISFTAPDVDNETTFTFEVTVSDGDGNSDTDDVNVTVLDTDDSTGTPSEGEVVYRVNAGGSQISASDGGPAWSADTASNPSPYVNTGSTYSTSDSITLDESVPSGTPTSLFQTERFDYPTGSEMQWSFSENIQSDQEYEVRLYFAEIYVTDSNNEGPRTFDVTVEGQTVLNDYNIFQQYGHDVGAMESVQVTPTDGTLNVEFLHEQQNPKISAIEIVAVNDTSDGNSAPTIDPIADQTVVEGNTTTVPVNASDPDGDTVSLSVSGPDFVTLSNGELTIAPQSGDTGTYTVEVTASDGNGGTATESFQLTVESVSDGGSGSAEFTVTTGDGEGIDASTYSAGTMTITNTGDTQITSVTYDLSSSVLPDVVFDPNGTAGDTVAKDFTVDSGGSETGVLGGSFSAPHNGENNEEGYDEMTIGFNDFENGETLAFSVDIDPTSIQGAEDSGAAGSVSGLEMSGATITVEYADGSTQTTDLFGDGSVGGSVATAKTGVASAPTLGVEGVSLDESALDARHSAATVGSAGQTITVSGPVDATVELLHVEGQLELANQANGYEIEQYEANTAENVDYRTVDLGSDGQATVDVTLTNTSGTDAEGGFNYFLAAVQDGSGDTGLTSDVVVLKYDQNSDGSTTQQALHRVNAGGGTIAANDGGQDWTGVTGTGSQYLASASGGNYCAGDEITPDSTVPSSTPDAVFDCERYGTMSWEFPVNASQQVDVRLFIGNSYSGTSESGQRQFNVSIEGQQVLSNYDPVADVGHATGTMKTFTVTDDGDGTVTVTFSQGAADNPIVNAIEVVAADDTSTTTATTSFQSTDSTSTTTAVEADAGDQQTVTEGDSVELDATGSTGDGLSYSWEQLDGPSVSLSEGDTATPTFTAPDVDGDTTFTFEVTVSDGDASDTDTVVVSVTDDTTQSTNDTEHTLTVAGNGSESSYEFSVTGTITPENVDSDDSVSADGSTATGVVSGWNDTYTFTGELTEVTVNGTAEVYVDGEKR